MEDTNNTPLTEADRLRQALRRLSEEVKRLAFEMPPPNEYTPRFVMIATQADRMVSESALRSLSRLSDEIGQEL